MDVTENKAGMLSVLGPNIYEDKNEQQGTMIDPMSLMTKAQRKRGEYFQEQYLQLKAELDSTADAFEWDELEKMYRCVRDKVNDDPDYPCSFVPLMTPIIEGTVAHMMTSELDKQFFSDNPDHEQYMPQLEGAADYICRESQFDLQFKDATRSYEVYGNGIVGIMLQENRGFDPGKPKKCPRVFYIPVRHFLVDGRIKDYKDLQDAEFIIHIIPNVSIRFIRDQYGDDYAEAALSATYTPDTVAGSYSENDTHSVELLNVWHRNNKKHNLQLTVMDTNGLIFKESNPNKPYYKGVGNLYPFAFGRMIPNERNLYGFGDGHILKPFQETLNRLMDEMELAARYSAQPKVAIDPDAYADAGDLNSDPSEPLLIEDPGRNFRVISPGNISNVIPMMMEIIFARAQFATRFSDIMTGAQQAASETATATQNRVTQAAVGIGDKKADIVAMMEFSLKYALNIAIHTWEKPFWTRLSRSKMPLYFDAKPFRNMPKVIPASPERIEAWRKNNPKAPASQTPKYEHMTSDDADPNAPTGVNLTFDVKMTISDDRPHGKVQMFNYVMSMLQVAVPKEDGTVGPLIEREKAIELIERYLGIRLTDKEKEDVAAASAVPQPMDGSAPSQNGNIPINPVSDSQNVQMPQGARVGALAPNLAGTTVGSANQDKRSMQFGGR